MSNSFESNPMILHMYRQLLYFYRPQSRDGQLLPVAEKALKLFITYNSESHSVNRIFEIQNQ